MTSPTITQRSVGGVSLRVYEWAGDGPPLLFAHATSFPARIWDSVIDRLSGRRMIAVDLRGHGQSSKHDPPYSWWQIGDDLAALAHAMGLRDAIGIGHSMGGHSVTLAAARAPQHFGGLVLVDPVIQPREEYGRHEERGADVGGRRDEWASPDEMYNSYHGRGPFATWDDRVLRDYCEWGLVRAPDGLDGYVLACPPYIEASMYAASTASNIYDDLATIEAPVRLLRARDRGDDRSSFSGSATAPDLASHFQHAQDFHFPDLSHFIPMEAPAMVAEHIAAMADQVGG